MEDSFQSVPRDAGDHGDRHAPADGVEALDISLAKKLTGEFTSLAGPRAPARRIA
jgi:hypothetical protein